MQQSIDISPNQNLRTISIVIVAYQNRNELLVTLYSLDQLIKSRKTITLELIVVDASPIPLSTIHEVSSLTSINHSGIHYINEADDGPYDAMNKGLTRAKMEWIWFLNSGDKAIDLPSHERFTTLASIIVGSWTGANGKIKLPSFTHGLSSHSRSEIGCGLCHQSMLFRRSVFSSIRYEYETYSLAAELNFFYSTILNNDYLLAPEFLVSYDNKTGLSKSKAVMHLRQSLAIYKKHGFSIGRKRLIRRFIAACWAQAYAVAQQFLFY